MATSTPAMWANLDSCHEIVAGPALRARLATGSELTALEPAVPEAAALADAVPETTGPETAGQPGTVVVLRPAGAHARPEKESGDGQPGRLTHGRHRREAAVAVPA